MSDFGGEVMPKVSVVIPVYNAEKYLRECLDSIVNQTFTDIEVICVDDGSTDDSISILEEYANVDNRFVILRQNNSGPSKARNCGWDIAKSEYVAFLDADDVWHPQKLELQYNYMTNNKDIYYSCHKKIVIQSDCVNVFYQQEKEIEEVIDMKPLRLLFKHYSNGATSSFVLKNIGDVRYNVDKRRSEDYLLTLEMLFKYRGIFIDCDLSASFKETFGDDGLSRNLWKMELGDLDTFNVLRIQGYIDIFTCLFASLFSLIKYLRRYLICVMRK